MHLMGTEDAALPRRHDAFFLLIIVDKLERFFAQSLRRPVGAIVTDVTAGQGNAIARSHPSHGDEFAGRVASGGKDKTFTRIRAALPLQAANDFVIDVMVLLAVEVPTGSVRETNAVKLELVLIHHDINRTSLTGYSELEVRVTKLLKGVSLRRFHSGGVRREFVGNQRSMPNDIVYAPLGRVLNLKDSVPDKESVLSDTHDLNSERCFHANLIFMRLICFLTAVARFVFWEKVPKTVKTSSMTMTKTMTFGTALHAILWVPWHSPRVLFLNS